MVKTFSLSAQHSVNSRKGRVFSDMARIETERFSPEIF